MDKFGAMVVERGRCGVCDRRGNRVRYTRKLQVPEYVRSSPSFIGRDTRRFGIECGCYGNLHRQVAHILDGVTA